MKTSDSDLKVNRNIYPDAVAWFIGPNWPLLGPIRRTLSHVTASGYIFRLTFKSLSDVVMLL